MASKEFPPHGDGGAWVAGEWVPLAECGTKFLCRGEKTSDQAYQQSRCGGSCATCPRSRTRHVAVKPDGTYDVVIVGAGVIGSAIARELSKYKLSCLLLEGSDDVSQGASKGNSGLAHAGFDDKPGSVRAKFCAPGCRMFPQLDRELHFGYQKNGALVVSRSEEEDKVLERLLEQGKTNGVQNLSIIKQAELRKLEPEIAESARSALYAKDAGIVMPYEFTIALAENAVDNGVELRLRRVVTKIEQDAAAADGNGLFTVTAKHWEAPGVSFKDPTGPRPGMLTQIMRNPAQLLPGIGVQAVLAAPLSIGVYLASKNPMLAGASYVVFFLLSIFFVPGVLPSAGGSSSSAASSSAANSDAARKAGIPTELPDGSKDAVAYEPSKGTKQGGPCVEEKIRCRFVINAAGVGSDKIAAMVGDDNWRILPRHGEYILLEKAEGHRAGRTLFPAPHPVLGKGVLVQHTNFGNMCCGPTARDELLRDAKSGKVSPNPEFAQLDVPGVIRYIAGKCAELCPSLDFKQVIHTFSGARAKSTRGDWIIEYANSSTLSNPRHFIHAAGIDSPGLAASPAIAMEIARLVKDSGAVGAELLSRKNDAFVATRKPLIVPKRGVKDVDGVAIKYGTYEDNQKLDPRADVVCKCEKVTRAEVVEALRRSLPIDNVQQIRRRTRAMMGYCQSLASNYRGCSCEERVAKIIAEETGRSMGEVGRRPWPASSFMPHRWFGDAEKEWLAKCGTGECDKEFEK